MKGEGGVRDAPRPPLLNERGAKDRVRVYNHPWRWHKSVTFFEQSWRYEESWNRVGADFIWGILLQVFVCLVVVAVAANYANGEFFNEGVVGFRTKMQIAEICVRL